MLWSNGYKTGFLGCSPIWDGDILWSWRTSCRCQRLDKLLEVFKPKRRWTPSRVSLVFATSFEEEQVQNATFSVSTKLAHTQCSVAFARRWRDMLPSRVEICVLTCRRAVSAFSTISSSVECSFVFSFARLSVGTRFTSKAGFAMPPCCPSASSDCFSSGAITVCQVSQCQLSPTTHKTDSKLTDPPTPQFVESPVTLQGKWGETSSNLKWDTTIGYCTTFLSQVAFHIPSWAHSESPSSKLRPSLGDHLMFVLQWSTIFELPNANYPEY